MHITGYTIGLNDIHLYAFHGVMKLEREIGAWFTIDIELTISDHGCLESDEIEGTVSYADVYEIISREMATPSRLLENVCYRTSKAIYEAFNQVKGITMTLTKDTPPMGGDRLNAAVTIRSRREA